MFQLTFTAQITDENGHHLEVPRVVITPQFSTSYGHVIYQVDGDAECVRHVGPVSVEQASLAVCPQCRTRVDYWPSHHCAIPARVQ